MASILEKDDGTGGVCQECRCGPRQRRQQALGYSQSAVSKRVARWNADWACG